MASAAFSHTALNAIQYYIPINVQLPRMKVMLYRIGLEKPFTSYFKIKEYLSSANVKILAHSSNHGNIHFWQLH